MMHSTSNISQSIYDDLINLICLPKTTMKRKEKSKLTASAGGRPPRTSPSPPVLLQGATSVPTKRIFRPTPQTIIKDGPFWLLNPFLPACLLVASFDAIVFTWSSSMIFKLLSPLCFIHLNFICDALLFNPEATSCP